MKRYIFCALLLVSLTVFGVTSFAATPGDRFFEVNEVGQEVIDTTSVFDSGGSVVDSGSVGGTVPTSAEVAVAIVGIYGLLKFAMFGVFPLSCSVIFCYLFGRWIYRLCISAV